VRGLADHAAIVTGAGRGIGRAIAERLLEEGARVLAVDQTSEVLSSIPVSARLATMTTNVAAAGAAEAIIRECVARFGSVAVLVNNAGIGDAPSLHETTDEVFDRYIDINLRAVFRLSRDVLPELRKSRGCIVNIASSVALQGYRRGAAYAAAKAGVIALTRNMAAEYGPEGVRVNAVAPGVVLTDLTAARLRTARFQALVVGTMPLGQAADPQDVAAAVAFLASADARMITGQVLAVDGGQTASVFISEEIVSNWETSKGTN
jgi:NAD(P)-dependent dehydrogenase (short-subunit alcohol dehydrogenase family)